MLLSARGFALGVLAGAGLLACGGGAASPSGAARPQPAAPGAARAIDASAPRPDAGPTTSAADAAISCAPPVKPERAPIEGDLDTPLPVIQESTSQSLAPFWNKLAAVARGERKEPVRIFFYGDSNLALDQLSGELRRRLQRELGDGGHGYLGVGLPARGYRHEDVRRKVIGHWETKIYSHHNPSGNGFGAGGMMAFTRSQHAAVVAGTVEDSPVGNRVSRFGVFYLAQPDGARFEVMADGQRVTTGNARADSERTEYLTIDVPDGAHEFRVQSSEDKRELRLFGVTLERTGTPGVVVDSYGVTGSTYHHLARMDNPVDRRMLELRKPDLVMFLIGTNYHRFDDNPISADRVMRLFRDIDPELPVIMMSPPDMIKTKHSTSSHPRIVEVAQQLERVAAETGAAFWDFRGAMGGDGAMHHFLWQGLAGEDLIHLSPSGARLMGARLAHALYAGLERHLDADPSAGCAGNAAVAAQR